MTWIQSIIIATLTGALGLLCGGLVMDGWATWHHISHFEGKADFAIVGFIIGLATARVVAAGVSPTFIDGLGVSVGMVVGISSLATGLGWLTGDHSPRIPAVVEIADRTADEDHGTTKLEDEATAFDAIPDDEPIENWLKTIQYGASEDRMAAVQQRVTAKSGWVVELTGLMIANDPQIAGAAMRFVQQLPQPSPELVVAVTPAGSDLAERIRVVNATPVERDPRYQGAAEISIRFSGWMVAVRSLREKCGADFVPELIEILKLPRVRDDSSEMRSGVRRVASYYASEWAGLEPLPGDPVPN